VFVGAEAQFEMAKGEFGECEQGERQYGREGMGVTERLSG